MDEKQARKYREMTEGPVGRTICRLAGPCIISMLVTAFYNMADTFFVGLLKSNAATGAVGVVFSMMAIIQAVGFFFGQGSGNYISRELGKNIEEIPLDVRGNRKLGERLYLENAEKFDWPDMGADEAGTEFCLGLRQQAAVL